MDLQLAHRMAPYANTLVPVKRSRPQRYKVVIEIRAGQI